MNRIDKMKFVQITQKKNAKFSIILSFARNLLRNKSLLCIVKLQNEFRKILSKIRNAFYFMEVQDE